MKFQCSWFWMKWSTSHVHASWRLLITSLLWEVCFTLAPRLFWANHHLALWFYTRQGNLLLLTLPNVLQPGKPLHSSFSVFTRSTTLWATLQNSTASTSWSLDKQCIWWHTVQMLCCWLSLGSKAWHVVALCLCLETMQLLSEASSSFYATGCLHGNSPICCSRMQKAVEFFESHHLQARQ